MRKVFNECCGCAVPAYPCIGDLCPQRHVERFFCDKCKKEETLYQVGEKELCVDCILENLPVVEGSEE